MLLPKPLLKYSCPSKTFLIGEYAALKQAPAWLLNTVPRFELHVYSDFEQGGNCNNIVEGSPAWKLLHKFSEAWPHYRLEFIDPHHGSGGFGASTAQYLMASAFLAWLDFLDQEIPLILLAMRDGLLQTYYDLAWDGQGIRPSGYDVLSQLTGKLCRYEGHSEELDRQTWPFDDLRICLVKTKNKLATHEHINTLQAQDIDDVVLRELVTRADDAIAQADPDKFCEAINCYRAALDQQGLLQQASKNLINRWSQLTGVQAAKGCGAMGADVILLCIDAAHYEVVTATIKAEGYNVFDGELSTGLELDAGSMIMPTAEMISETVH